MEGSLNKKLSDIGLFWAAESDLACAWADALDDREIKSRIGIIMTPDERRELVAEAIKRWEAYKWHKLGGAKELEEFLEDQGL